MQVNQAGWWLLKGTELQRSKRTDADRESDFTTMTVFVDASRLPEIMCLNQSVADRRL
jgi:hypothetical protein